MAGWCPNPSRTIAANAVLYTLGVVLYQIPKGVGIATSIRVGNILGRPGASVLASKNGACELVPSEVEEAVRDAKFSTWVGTAYAALLGVTLASMYIYICIHTLWHLRCIYVCMYFYWAVIILCCAAQFRLAQARITHRDSPPRRRYQLA